MFVFQTVTDLSDQLKMEEVIMSWQHQLKMDSHFLILSFHNVEKPYALVRALKKLSHRVIEHDTKTVIIDLRHLRSCYSRWSFLYRMQALFHKHYVSPEIRTIRSQGNSFQVEGIASA